MSANGTSRQSSTITTIAEALEVARDSPEGAQDPVVVDILETELAEIWGRIQDAPESYVMTRDEFAVFNLFQARFAGDATASAAISRYWNHQQLTNGI